MPGYRREKLHRGTPPTGKVTEVCTSIVIRIIAYGMARSRLPKLVEAAKTYGIDTLALTDINNTSCAYEFIRHCKNVGIRPLLGVEFRQTGKLKYVGLARNQEGFKELNQLLSKNFLAAIEAFRAGSSYGKCLYHLSKII